MIFLSIFRGQVQKEAFSFVYRSDLPRVNGIHIFDKDSVSHDALT